MKNLTKEQRYWLRRKDNQMWELMEDAEAVARQMRKYYASSSMYIQDKISGIYNRFKTEHHLTDKEAKALLNSTKNKDDINALINKIKRMPKSDEKDRLIAELESPAYASRIRRLQEVQELIDENASMIYKQDVRRTEKLLKNVANESYYETMYDIQARTGAAFSFSALDPKKVDKLLKRKWEGSSFSDRIWSNTQYLAETVKDELMLNFLTGRTEDEASKAIMERYSVGYNQARRLVRTESAYVANQMDADAYEEAGIMHYMIVATLDLKTSDICRELDGKIFLLKDKQVGENYPPFHPWCRTTTVESENPEELKSMKRRARDPETGKNYYVPAGTTYQEWYKGLEEKHGKQQLRLFEKETVGTKQRGITFEKEKTKEFTKRYKQIKAFKINGSNSDLHYSMYMSVNVDEKHQKAIATNIKGDLDKAIAALGIQNAKNAPTVVIAPQYEIRGILKESLNKLKLSEYVCADYNCINNTLFIYDQMGTKSDKVEQIKNLFTVPEKSYSTHVHELYHWMDAQEYQQINGKITKANISEYNDYIQSKSLKEVEKIMESGYDIHRVSYYAQYSMDMGDVVEAYTEYRTMKALKKGKG